MNQQLSDELDISIHLNKIEKVKAILSNSSFTFETVDSFRVLKSSVKYPDILKLLIDKGININIQDDERGGTALITASLRGQPEAVKLLLDAGADVNKSFESGGLSAFGYACSRGHLEVMKLLIGMGKIDINDAVSNWKSTPLLEAAQSSNFKAVKFLIKNGTNPNARDEMGHTAIHAAVFHEQNNSIAFIRNAPNVELNIIDAQDVQGKTALFYAAERGNIETVNTLISFSANVNIPDNSGYTPLMVATKGFHFEIVKRLVEVGADKNATAIDGHTVESSLQAATEEMNEFLVPTDQIETLYSIIPIKWFNELLEKKEMSLTQIASWDDTFEGTPLKQLYTKSLKQNFPEIPDRLLETIVNFNHKSLYAQCWTTLPESDAMWRIYSSDKMGIRISVKREEFINAVKRELPFQFGRVSYGNPDEAVRKMADKIKNSSSDPIVKGVFYKRLEFNHEHEFRIGTYKYPLPYGINFPSDDKNPELVDELIKDCNFANFPPRIFFPFDPKLIQEIVFDPGADDWFVNSVKRHLKTFPELAGVVVRKSSLYNPFN
ncbi:MAG: ankyrin repeat domain-containing protein [Aridibacter sp.]